MFRKPHRHGAGDDQGHGGLIITPLLDLLVSLIPILIIGVVLSRINVVDVAVSKPVANTAPPKSKFDLSLKIRPDDIELVLNGKTRQKISQKDTKGLDTLHRELVSIKQEFPQEFELKIEPENGTELNNIMEIIDTAREVKTGDPQMTRKDESTGKEVRIKFLFPRVILRGVYS